MNRETKTFLTVLSRISKNRTEKTVLTFSVVNNLRGLAFATNRAGETGPPPKRLNGVHLILQHGGKIVEYHPFIYRHSACEALGLLRERLRQAGISISDESLSSFTTEI